jgi:hypothetical protein
MEGHLWKSVVQSLIRFWLPFQKEIFDLQKKPKLWKEEMITLEKF